MAATWGTYKKTPLRGKIKRKKEPKPEPSPQPSGMRTGRGRIPLAQPIGSAGTRKQTVAFEGTRTVSPWQRAKRGLKSAWEATPIGARISGKEYQRPSDIGMGMSIGGLGATRFVGAAAKGVSEITKAGAKGAYAMAVSRGKDYIKTKWTSAMQKKLMKDTGTKNLDDAYSVAKDMVDQLGLHEGVAARQSVHEMLGRAKGAAETLRETGVGKRKTFIALAKAWRKGAGKGAGAKLDQAAAGKAVKPKYYGMTKGGKLYTYNTKTGRLTHQLFTKMYAQFAKRPKITGAALLAIIGSYPFSGFLKEEALQQAGWAVDEAIKEGNLEKAEEALAFEKEMFKPDVADQIIQKIPFVNVVASIKKFYDAVWIKHKTYEDTIERMKSGEKDVMGKEIEARDIAKEENIATQQEAGQAHDIAMAERWEEYQQHKEDYDNETREYYEQRLIAEKASDLEMREFWADYQNRKFEYWEAYQKRREAERPSKLGFGLLR